MFFNGRSEHSLDSKNRLTIPARFREGLGSQATLTVDEAGCLQLWRREAFGAHVEAMLESIPRLSPERDVVVRYYMHNSENVDVDSAGRVPVASNLAHHAGLNKQVVVAGSGEFLELWDPARWDDSNETVAVDIAAIRRRHAG